MSFSYSKIKLASAILLAEILTGCSGPVSSEQPTYIFDGVSFTNWEGDTSYWKIEDSTIIGTVTPEHPLEHNTFLIYKGQMPSDFELTLEYRISNEGNSGVQYRSQQLPELSFALKGYQADIDGNNTYTGQNYEERGRGFLAKRGEVVEMVSNLEPKLTDSLGSSEELKKHLIPDDWNELRIRASGYLLQHYINGVKMSEVLDMDTVNRAETGAMGLQLHVAPQMQVSFRKIRILPLGDQ